MLVELAVVALVGLLHAHPLRGPEAVPDCQVAGNLAQQEPVVRGHGDVRDDLLGMLVNVPDLHLVSRKLAGDCAQG